MNEIMHSEDIQHLTKEDRQVALAILNAPAREKAEEQVFVPRRLAIQKITRQWKGIIPVHVIHLTDGSKIVFNPLKPGPFVLKRNRNYIRALYPSKVMVMDNYAHVLAHPRMKFLHGWLKGLFAVMRKVGIGPIRYAKVFSMDGPTFRRLYVPKNDE